MGRGSIDGGDGSMEYNTHGVEVDEDGVHASVVGEDIDERDTRHAIGPRKHIPPPTVHGTKGRGECEVFGTRRTKSNGIVSLEGTNFNPWAVLVTR